MDCNVTSTKKNGFFGRRAFTLVELQMAIALSALVATGLMGFTYYANRSFAAMANYFDLELRSRRALDRMTRDIREAESLVSHSTNSISLHYDSGADISIDYNPASREVVRSDGIETELLLKGCDYFMFDIFQRTPVAGAYEQYPAATTDTCKLIQLTWICSREIMGVKANTESVQSAKIVIRKQ